MNTRFCRRAITAFAVFLCFLAASAAALEVSGPQKVRQYEPFILEFTLPYFNGNPNDPGNVKVEARITLPDGGRVTIPAFCLYNKKGTGISLWEVRFTPVVPGRYDYSLHAAAKTLDENTGTRHFDVRKSENRGFLRRSRNNPYYLVFDSGEPFFGIGHNIAWAYENSLSVFDRYFTELEKNGCNLTRVWLSEWSFQIEWEKMGRYDRDASLDLDKLLDLAKKRGIYIILCLGTYGDLMIEKGSWSEDRWGMNPYNRKNGGPCTRPEDLFTDPEAKRWYKNKLRYIISRWSYSPNILAFEFWNELNAPREWIEEMSAFVKEINPHGQFLTTSMGYPWGEIFDKGKVWSVKDIDVITIHLYGNRTVKDVVSESIQKSYELAAVYDKPFLIAEIGMDAGKDDKVYDPGGKGTLLHNSIWATALSRYFGSAMGWWWDTYIRPKNLYFHYKGLNAFLRGVNWDSEIVKVPVTSQVISKKAPKKKPALKDLTIKPADKWGKVYAKEFTVLKNGDLIGGTPTKYLQGEKGAKLDGKQVYHVDFPSEGNFRIKVGMVAHQARLLVYLDDKKVLDREFTTGPGKEGPWKRSLYRRDKKVYQCVYDQFLEIRVPAGKHAIRIENSGKDWIGIKEITLTDYVSEIYANARCLGLVVGDEILFWIQNKSYNWKNTYYSKEPAPIKNAYLDVFDLEEGAYKVEWWDTFKGDVISREKVSTKSGVLRLNIREFSQDTACKVKKVR